MIQASGWGGGGGWVCSGGGAGVASGSMGRPFWNPVDLRMLLEDLWTMVTLFSLSRGQTTSRLQREWCTAGGWVACSCGRCCMREGDGAAQRVVPSCVLVINDEWKKLTLITVPLGI